MELENNRATVVVAISYVDILEPKYDAEKFVILCLNFNIWWDPYRLVFKCHHQSAHQVFRTRCPSNPWYQPFPFHRKTLPRTPSYFWYYLHSECWKRSGVCKTNRRSFQTKNELATEIDGEQTNSWKSFLEKSIKCIFYSEDFPSHSYIELNDGFRVLATGQYIRLVSVFL